MTDELKMQHGFDDFQMRLVGKATATPNLFKMAMKVDHAGLAPLSKKKEITVENMFQYGGYVAKGPGLVKGWTDVRDLPRPPKSSENFRSWYKKHKAGELND